MDDESIIERYAEEYLKTDQAISGLNKVKEDIKGKLKAHVEEQGDIDDKGHKWVQAGRYFMQVQRRQGQEALNKERAEEWAKEKGIMGNSTSKDQLFKTLEELWELTKAIIKGDRVKTIDGYGDVLVTLIIGMRLEGLDARTCLNHAWDEIKGRTGEMKDGDFVKS